MNHLQCAQRSVCLPAPCRCSRRGRPRRRATSVRTQAGTTRNGTSPTSTWRCAPHECMNESTVGAQRPNVAGAPCLGRLGCSHTRSMQVHSWTCVMSAPALVGPTPKQQATWLITPLLPHPISNSGATGADVARPGCGSSAHSAASNRPGNGAARLGCNRAFHPPMPSAWLLCPDAASNQPGKITAQLGCTGAFDPLPASDLPRSPIAPSCRHLQPPWRIFKAPAGDQQAEHAPLLFPTQGALGGGCEGRGACTHAQHDSSCTQATFFFKNLVRRGEPQTWTHPSHASKHLPHPPTGLTRHHPHRSRHL